MLKKRFLWALATITLATGCYSAVSTAQGPTGPELPPLGLASTAVWLEKREANVAPAVRSQDIPTSQIRAVSSGQISARAAASTPVAVPDRTRPTTRRGRALQAFTDVCVASVSDPAGLSGRAQAVNLRDFDEPARVSTENEARLVQGGIDDGPIRVIVGTNPAAEDAKALCVVTMIGANGRAAAQDNADAVAAAGFRLDPIPAPERGVQRFRIVGAPDGTTLSLRTNIFGTGATIAWR